MSHKEIAKKILRYVQENSDKLSEKTMISWISLELKKIQKKAKDNE